MTWWIGAVGLLLSGGASAQDDAETPTFDEDLPAPSLSLERVPPSTSSEFGLSLSYGTLTYWRDYVRSGWIGFGLRGGWGRHYANSRVGFDVHFVAEGPIGVHTTLALEPHVTWDHVSNGVLIGAGLGPALMYHAAAGESLALKGEKAVTFGPSATARIGWSQPWSRVGRRMFVVAEPKIRMVDGAPNPLVSLVVGSGRGR